MAAAIIDSTTKDEQQKLITDFYIKNKRDICAAFFNYTHNMEDAEDMAQNLYIRLFKYSGIIMPNLIANFIWSSIYRMITDEMRHRAFVNRVIATCHEQEEKYETVTGEDLLITEHIESLEKQFVDRLTPSKKKVYNMCRFENKEVAEVAQVLNISNRTVESLLYVSRREIRQQLRKVL